MPNKDPVILDTYEEVVLKRDLSLGRVYDLYTMSQIETKSLATSAP